MAVEVQTAADPIAEARAHVERLHSAEQELSRLLLSLREDLVTAEGTAGDATLEAALAGTGSVKAATSRVTTLQAEIVATGRAIELARQRRIEAIPAVWRAEAAPLRERAAVLREQADEREVKTREMLRELEEYEGCSYVPKPPDRPSLDGGLVGGAPQIVYITVPKTEMLRREAAGLEYQAETIQAQTVALSGYVSASSREELLAQLEARGPMQIVPAMHDLLEWLEPALEAVREHRRKAQAQADVHPAFRAESPIPASVYWTEGKLDTRRSYVGTDRDRESIRFGAPQYVSTQIVH